MNRLLETLDWIAGNHGQPAINENASLDRIAYRTIEFRRRVNQGRSRPAYGDRGPDGDALDLAS